MCGIIGGANDHLVRHCPPDPHHPPAPYRRAHGILRECNCIVVLLLGKESLLLAAREGVVKGGGVFDTCHTVLLVGSAGELGP